MQSIRVTAQLWVKESQFDDFATFEIAAFAIMKTHGGFVRHIEKNHDARDGQPHEIHTLIFPNIAAFEAYKADQDLLALAALRQKCIAKTEVSVEPNA